jgi:GT2 family glycosyltransferase/glycosyltransferase involved in cell wall biosynthesis
LVALNPLVRKYRRFQSLERQQGLGAALLATRASLSNSARYRWLVLRERTLAGGRRHKALGVGAPDNSRFDPVGFLPAADQQGQPAPDSVAVVVPVYRDLATSRACLESVLRSSCAALAHVIVVDDASPEPSLSAYLDQLAEAGSIRLVRNEKNLGFVGSVNRGMEAAGDLDVVLLNSDTVVAGNWLDRLSRHAATEGRVGTITPLSNNATICSYPTLDGWPELPSGETVRSIDAACADANVGRVTEIPTGVGFCMYIPRACLSEVGLFDEAAFKRGYGEENDFCLRAARRGWRSLLAADTFVWHQGEVSFGSAAAELQRSALDELRKRYPGYLREVARHVERDPARPWRVAATAARFRLGERPVILMITHALGGGTEKHVLDLCRRFGAEDSRFLILQPTPQGPVRLWSPDPTDGLDVHWQTSDRVESLAALIRSFGVARAHVHHVLAMPFDVRDLIRRLGIPFDFTVHDFYSICPRVRLARPSDGYCGGPETAKCRVCLALLPPADVRDVELWQARLAWLLTKAERVICPSRDAAGHIAAFVHGPDLVAALHDTLDHEVFREPVVSAPQAGGPLRIALIGVLCRDKGAALVGECARLARRSGMALEFSLVGFVPDEDSPLVRDAGLEQSGPYELDQLQSKISAAAPHLVWFPAVWPETYSYTLGEAMVARLPILVPDIGAFSERIAGRPWSWMSPWDASPAELVALLERIGDQLRRGEWQGSVDGAVASIVEDVDRYPVVATDGFYDFGYLAPLAREATAQAGKAAALGRSRASARD